MSIPEDLLFWYHSAQASGKNVDAIAILGLQGNDYHTRVGAVRTLAKLGTQFVTAIADMLTDAYPQVRFAAIQALEHLDPSGAWRKRLVFECYVPAGEFLMGCDEWPNDPVHLVHVKAYYIGKYPVTYADYKRYREEEAADLFEIPKGKENHPVGVVNWFEARSYAIWAGMRLPTEAEWEKAASWEERGKRKRVYPWGQTFDSRRCNTAESGIADTTPVGKYSPGGDSPYGCSDMAGNVWEWCNSQEKPYPYQLSDGREDMYDVISFPNLGNVPIVTVGSRVLRGGSWSYDKRCARCAARNYYEMPTRTLTERGSHIGFRVAFSSGS